MQPVVKGIQSQKVVANAKHFIQNNQETNRVGVPKLKSLFEMVHDEPAYMPGQRGGG